MFDDPLGPITHFSWGCYIIQGQTHSDDGQGVGKDIRIVGDTVSEWAERHGHELKIKMITGIYDQKIEILVIGVGVENALKVPKETLQDIHAHGIAEVEIHPTPAACARFNELFRQGKKAALLSHGTC
jgi:hypothetical protein